MHGQTWSSHATFYFAPSAMGFFVRPIILLLFTVLLSGCNKPSAERGAKGRSPPLVEAVQVRSGQVSGETRLTGLVRAQHQVFITSQIAGSVADVVVNDGDFVQVGDLLVQLRDTEYRSRLSQARANLEVAQARQKQAAAQLSRLQTQWHRVNQLAAKGLISDFEVDVAQADLDSSFADLDVAGAQVRQAAAVVEEFETQLSHTRILSPLAGQVGFREVEKGQYLTTDTVLLQVGDLSRIRIRMVLREQLLREVKAGTPVVINTENIKHPAINAHISRITPFLDPTTHSTIAEIDLPGEDTGLLPGMFVTIDVSLATRDQSIVLPTSAIYRHPHSGMQGVYVIEATPSAEESESPKVGERLITNVVFRPITVTATNRVVAGVTGIMVDDWVITVGQHLFDGRESVEAQVIATDWEHILQLQQLDNRDLVQRILQKGRSSITSPES